MKRPAPTSNLSGGSYVQAALKSPLIIENEEPKFLPVRIASEMRCQHVQTICLLCAPDWQEDYIIRWKSTSGGRSMEAQLKQKG